MSKFVYDLVTSHIVLALSRGTVPWRKPWKGSASVPINAVSRRPYRGINLFLLGIAPFEDRRWVTFRQAQELGGNVRKGEKSSIAVFYKSAERDEDEGAQAVRRYPVLRFYNLFNVSQTEGLRMEPEEAGLVPGPERIGRAEELVTSMCDRPNLVRSASGAWYRPLDDTVGMPPLGSFRSSDAYYATLFHELGHSTGHERRLNRSGVTGTVQFGSENYGHEELVAELASAYVCSAIGLDNSLVENSASYIDGWMNSIRCDNRAIFRASSQAQKAADYILGVGQETVPQP